jgi:hypothetical protein
MQMTLAEGVQLVRQILSTDPHVIAARLGTLRHASMRRPNTLTNPAQLHVSTLADRASGFATSSEVPELDQKHTRVAKRSDDRTASLYAGGDVPSVQRVHLASMPELEVTIFAKRPEQHLPLWDAWVSPTVHCRDMMVESWVHGPGRMADTCGTASCVVNAAGARFAAHAWTIEQDHAKWALCCDKEIACFGDLNRELAQSLRGGLAMCLRWTANSAHSLYEWVRQHARTIHSQCESCTC